MKYFSVTLLTGLLVVASFVYWIDPAGRWHHRIQIPHAPLEKGQAWVTPKTNFDDRLLRLAQIDAIETPDVFLLGSSRVIAVSSRYFKPGLKVFNAGVAGPLVYDFIGFWQALSERQKFPSYVVIFVDPWIINGNAPLFYHWSINRYVRHFLAPDSSSRIADLEALPEDTYLFLSEQFHNLTELLKWKELRFALRYFLEFGSHQPTPYVTAEESVPKGVNAYRWDGSVISWDHETSRNGIRLEALTQADQKNVLSLYDWRQDDNLVGLFQALLADMQRHHARVMLVLPPYHPATFNVYKERREYRQSLEQYQHVLQDQSRVFSSVGVCDVVDPEKTGCTEDDFDDWIHLRSSGVKKVLARCLGTPSDWAGLAR